jgi:quercetin dioxygenase-like cupin family protein
MNTPRSDDSVAPELAGVSRRTVVGRSATGLALALLARSFSQAAAQEATPAAEGGLPEGMSVSPVLEAAVIADMPPAPVGITIFHMTLEPGAVTPISTFAFPSLGYTESGTTTCPGEEGRVVYGPDGTVQASGAGDLPVPTGSSIYTPANVGDGARNDGTEPTTMLMIQFMPAGEMGTPTMDMDMGTPTP